MKGNKTTRRHTKMAGDFILKDFDSEEHVNPTHTLHWFAANGRLNVFNKFPPSLQRVAV